MILYKKSFPLDNNITFYQYITLLRKEYFPNFVITVDKIQSTENYKVLIFFVASYWRSVWRNSYDERVLLKECIIHYSNGEKLFTLQASPKIWNLLFASVQVLSAILFIALIIIKGMSLNNIVGFTIVIIIWLSPLILTYIQDKNLLDKVGSIGNDRKGK
jgi:hypothetical protein